MSRFTCTQLAPLPRRTVLAAIGAMALAPLAARAADAPRVTGLIDAAGRSTEVARALAGQNVTLRGYLDLAPGARDLILTEMPAGACGLCGLSHDAGAAMPIEFDGPFPTLTAQEMVSVSGRLTVGSGGDVRLTRAVITA